MRCSRIDRLPGLRSVGEVDATKLEAQGRRSGLCGGMVDRRDAGASRQCDVHDDLAKRAGGAGHDNDFFPQHDISGQSGRRAHTMAAEI